MITLDSLLGFEFTSEPAVIILCTDQICIRFQYSNSDSYLQVQEFHVLYTYISKVILRYITYLYRT